MAFYDTTWYCNAGDQSTTGYYAVTKWATGATIAAGALRRQNAAPAVNSERVFACIVAGTTHATTEPTWVITRGAKTTDNTVTWQECTGASAVNGDLTNTPSWTGVTGGIATAITLGAIIKRNNVASYWICSTAGTTGTSEPAWANDTAGTTRTDGTVTWSCLGVVGNFTGGQAPHARINPACATNWFAPGNTVYIGDNHAESQATTINITPTTTTNSVNRILCHNHAGNYPPASTDLTTGASISTTASASINFSPSPGFFYVYGLAFLAGVGGSNNAFINLSPVNALYSFERCLFKLSTTLGAPLISLGSNNAGAVTWNNCTVYFGHVNQFIDVETTNFTWQNTGQVLASGSLVPSVNGLMGNTVAARLSSIVLESLDLSQLTGPVFGVGICEFGNWTAKDCKLNASTSFVTPFFSGQTLQFVRCDSGATAYKSARYQYEGTETTETSITRVGGASDPTGQAQSRKIVTTANSQWLRPFKAEPYAQWNPTTGANVTVTVCGTVNAGALPNNDDIWLEVEYLQLAAATFAVFASDASLHNVTLSGGNLVATNTTGASNDCGARVPTAMQNSGKFYFEAKVTAFVGGTANGVGIAPATTAPNNNYADLTGSTSGWNSIQFSGGGVFSNGSLVSPASLGARSNGDVIGLAVDLDNRMMWFRVAPSGNWNNSGTANPATNTGGVAIPAGALGPFCNFGGGGSAANNITTLNFGASTFSGAVPSGFTSGWPGTPAASLGTIVTTTKANVLAANAAVASDSSTWNNIPAFVSWNPSDLVNVTLSGSNLIATLTSNNGGVRSPAGPSSGKYYWEIIPGINFNTSAAIGVALASVNVGTVYSAGAAGAVMLNAVGNVNLNGSTVVSSIGNLTIATAACIALDLTAGLIWFKSVPSNFWNGSSSNNPATGVGGVSISSIMTGPLYPFCSAFNSGSIATANFGGSAFSGTVPSGFTAGVPPAWTPFKLTTTLSSPQPGLAGYLHARVRAAKPSSTFYIDPMVVLS
jgi:hypothetical protein